jgi:hypothetical protein
LFDGVHGRPLGHARGRTWTGVLSHPTRTHIRRRSRPMHPRTCLDSTFAHASALLATSCKLSVPTLPFSSGEEILVPVTVHLAVPEDEGGSGPAGTPSRLRLKLVAPCLLPPLHWIKSIEVDSPRYWPMRLVRAQSERVSQRERERWASSSTARQWSRGVGCHVERRGGPGGAGVACLRARICVCTRVVRCCSCWLSW